MSSNYLLRVKTEFSAAHALRGYQGDCARLHGHNWKIEAEFYTTKLNDIGIGIDFKIIKSHLEEVLMQLDHQNINEIAPFDKLNPTAENMVAWIYQEVKNKIPTNTTAKLNAVTIWETDRSSVRYSE